MFMLIQTEVSCKWINDSQHFLLEHFDTIKDSPSHIYHSALPLCPPSSWLCDCYRAEFSQVVKVVEGLPAGWGPCSCTVSLSNGPQAHTSWKDLIAVGFGSSNSVTHDIVIIDATTGIHLAVLSGDANRVSSLTFSSDGTLLISGDRGGTIKLWDIQTGGIIETFDGHTGTVRSVSLSLDHTVIVSGSRDETIRLWDTGTGDCCCVIDWHTHSVSSVCFSPINSQLFISASDGGDNGAIQQWDINGHQIGPTYEGRYATFSPDGSLFVSWGWEEVSVVRSTGSGTVVAELHASGNNPMHCCFSPNGKFVAGCHVAIVYVWDISNSDPHLVGTFIGHTEIILSLAFASSHVSSADHSSVKLWQFSTSSVEPVITYSESTSLPPVPVEFVSLQANDCIAILFDATGVVRCFDTLTGICKVAFQAPYPGPEEVQLMGMQLVHDRIILVWLNPRDCLRIWDSEKDPQVIDVPWVNWVMAPKVSGDGSKVFLPIDKFIRVFSVETGELVGEVGLEGELGFEYRGWPDYDPLIVDGSKVCVNFGDSQTQGWDFGTMGSAPIPLFNIALDSPHLELNIKQKQQANRYRIRDGVTGNDIFQLSGRYANPTDVHWDGQCLVAGYSTGDVVILNLNYMSSNQRYAMCWPSHGCKGVYLLPFHK